MLITRLNGELYQEAEAAFASLAVGVPLSLHRKPDTVYDQSASLLDATGRRLGTIARIRRPCRPQRCCGAATPRGCLRLLQQ